MVSENFYSVTVCIVQYISTVCVLYTHNAIIYVRVASVIATIGYFCVIK